MAHVPSLPASLRPSSLPSTWLLSHTFPRPSPPLDLPTTGLEDVVLGVMLAPQEASLSPQPSAVHHARQRLWSLPCGVAWVCLRVPEALLLKATVSSALPEPRGHAGQSPAE